MVRHENYTTIAAFLYELVCQWGAIEVIVTDNAPQYLQAVEHLAEKHHVGHIRISPYNSCEGPIERRHYDVREAIMKAAEGDESKWPDVAPAVFWAERVTIQKSTGYSPYYLVHGVEPLLPFDLAEGTYLAPNFDGIMSTEDLIALRAKMLLKRPRDLARVREKVLKARWESVKQLERDLGHRIKEFNFQLGNLVLVRNSRFDKGLSNKTKPRFLGPMVVIRKTRGGSYILGELDGALSKLRFAAFRLIPYLPHNIHSVPVTKLTDFSQDELEDLTHDSGNILNMDFDAETN